MAGYDPSSMYDVSAPPVAAGVGGVEAAGMLTLQRELLRRAQFEQQAQEQQRQAAMDQHKLEMDVQDRELKQQQIDVGKDARAANAAKTVEDTNARYLKRFGETHAIDSDLNPTDVAGLNAHDASGLALRIAGKAATPAVPAVTGQMDPDSGLPAADMQAVPAQAATPDRMTYRGTDAEQQTQKEQAMLQMLADQSANIDTSDPIQMLAIAKQAGLTKIPAGMLSAKKTPAEKMTEHTATMMHLWAQDDMAKSGALDPDTGKPVQPLDARQAADLKVFRSTPAGQTQGQKTAISIDMLDRRNDNTVTNADTRYTQSAKKSLQDSLRRENTALAKDQERTDRALRVLSTPGWLSDATAVPEYLQVMAGGMGSGLRMTTAEINNVQGAQSYFDQMKAKAGKMPFAQFFDIQPVTIQKEMRAQMLSALQAVRAARDRTIKLETAASASMKDAKTPDDINAIEQDYWTHRNEVEKPGVKPAAATGPRKFKATIE